ncbi:MAG: hypothetical protein ACOYYJ_00990 [Chloroflexota bacterium]
MSRMILSALIALLALSACTPVAPPPTTTSTTAPTETPQPADVPLELARVQMPPETPGQLDLSQVPGFEGATIVQIEDVPVGLVRGVYNLIPVATNDGLLATENNGFTATAVPEQISRRDTENNLEILARDPNSEGGHWRYFSASGAEQFIPKTVQRPDGNRVYLAVSRNLEDIGVTYFISVDESGRVSRYAKAVAEKNAEGQIPALEWQSAEGKWPTRGHEALTADHVTDLKANQEAGNTVWSQDNNPVLGTKRLEQYAFTDADGVHTYLAEQIAWMPLQVEGAFQPGQNGEEVYGLTMLLAADGAPEFVRAKGQSEWQAAEKFDLPNGGRLFGAAMLYNGELVERMFVMLGNIAAGVKEVLNENGHDVAVLGEGLRYVWGENGWGKELPESLMKVQERLTPGGFELVGSQDGYYEIFGADGQKVEGVKVYDQGDRAYSTLEIAGLEPVVQPVKVITFSQQYGLVWGIRNLENGIWSTPRSLSSEEEVNGHEGYPFMLGVDEDSDFAPEMRSTALAEHERATEKTELYDPASEFEGISITVNETTIDNFDNTPEEWQLADMKNTTIPGRFWISPRSKISGVVYDDDSTLAYARPMQVALGKGWVPFWRRLNGKEEMDVLVPVVAKDTDGSIKIFHSILRETDIPKIAHLLNRNERGKIWTGWLYTALNETGNEVGGKELLGFSIRANQQFWQTFKASMVTDEQIDFIDPNKTKAIITVPVLPAGLEQAVLVIKVRPENQKNQD